MLLQKDQYKEEIADLYKEHLHETVTGGTFFGHVEDDVLQAVASVRCLHGHWYLRACVVKPEFRGKGLQRELIRERLDYLAQKTDRASVSVEPHNHFSIDNIVAEGFSFATTRKLPDGRMVSVYRKEL
jgi:ribosomal protein S18 acetylase RimI-like enzyme